MEEIDLQHLRRKEISRLKLVKFNKLEKGTNLAKIYQYVLTKADQKIQINQYFSLVNNLNLVQLNEYTARLIMTYMRFMVVSEKVKSEDSHLFSCLIPPQPLQGLYEFNDATRYKVDFFGTKYYTYEITLMLFNQGLVQGRIIHHRCKHPKCANYACLAQVFQADNVRW